MLDEGTCPELELEPEIAELLTTLDGAQDARPGDRADGSPAASSASARPPSSAPTQCTAVRELFEQGFFDLVLVHA